MSRYIATRAIRGAQGMVREAEEAVNAALAELGPDDAGRSSPTPRTTCR